MYPSWIREDGTELDLSKLDGILINTEDVQWVEFVKPGERYDQKSTT